MTFGDQEFDSAFEEGNRRIPRLPNSLNIQSKILRNRVSKDACPSHDQDNDSLILVRSAPQFGSHPKIISLDFQKDILKIGDLAVPTPRDLETAFSTSKNHPKTPYFKNSKTAKVVSLQLLPSQKKEISPLLKSRKNGTKRKFRTYADLDFSEFSTSWQEEDFQKKSFIGKL